MLNSHILLLASTLDNTDYRTFPSLQKVLLGSTELLQNLILESQPLNLARDKFQEYPSASRAYKFLPIKQGGLSMCIVWASPSGPTSILGRCRTAKRAWAGCLAVEVHLPSTVRLSMGASPNSQTAVAWVVEFLAHYWVWTLKFRIYHCPKSYSLVSVSTSCLPNVADCRRVESLPSFSCSQWNSHQKQPFWHTHTHTQKPEKPSGFLIQCGGGLYPKHSWHRVVGKNSVINLTRKFYKSL